MQPPRAANQELLRPFPVRVCQPALLAGQCSASHAAPTRKAGAFSLDFVDKTLHIRAKYTKYKRGVTKERQRKDLQPLQALFHSSKTRIAGFSFKIILRNAQSCAAGVSSRGPTTSSTS